MICCIGCGRGYCETNVTVDISIAEGIKIPMRFDALAVVAETVVDETKLTGFTSQGIPIRPGEESPGGAIVEVDRDTRTAQWIERMQPYPTWYYAYVDSNLDGDLDEGEPFGTYDKNPIDGECKDHTVPILISDTFAGG
jgi:hypothetical protein